LKKADDKSISILTFDFSFSLTEMFSGRIHAAMLDNRMNNKKPFMIQYFMNTGHGAGEGVKPLNFRPPITGNLNYKPGTNKINVGLPGNQVGLNVAMPDRPMIKPAVIASQYIDRMYRPHPSDTAGNTSAIVGNPNMRQYLAEQLGRKTMVGNEGVSEQGRSPM
jgi:hypothetical protein